MKRIFDNDGDFQAYYNAVDWCHEKGFSVGSMCGKQPIGLLKGNFIISKWRNLRPKEIDALDGKITGDMRSGPVTVEIYERNNE